MKIKIITFLMVYLVFPSVNFSYAEKLDNDITVTWELFLEAISNYDIEQVKKLSSNKIRCFICLENTEKEYNELNKLLRQKGAYEKIYHDKVYIPLQEFCDDDIPLIFTKDFLKILKQNETFYDRRIFNGKVFYEILVTTTLPGEVSPEHEGGQHVFEFIKTKKGYRLNGIETIP